MILPELKLRAFELRRSGRSYNYITRETGIASGMLSYWFSKLSWSKKISDENAKNLIKSSRIRIIEMNSARKLSLANKYEQIESVATQEFEIYKNDTLFIGSLMLYLGEGSKSTLSRSVRISNTDPFVLKIFINFLIKYCKVNRESIKFWLLSYPDIDSEKCLIWWGNELNLNNINFYKTQIIQGKHKTKRLLYGVGNIILSSKVLKVKILKWIELASIELS